MWQQILNAVGALHGQACHHIAQVGIRVMPVHARRLDQTHDGGGALARAQAASEEPVLAAERDRPDTILDPVVVDWDLPVVEVTDERRPTLEAIVDRLCGCGTIGYLLPSRAEPSMEFINDGFGQFLP